MGKAGGVPELIGTVEAPAKLTLSLRVVGRREDGYHLLDAEMVTVNLTDSLQFRPGDGLRVSGPAAARVPRGRANLIIAALAAVGRRVQVSLVKRIPVGAGLGGGSADAAAVGQTPVLAGSGSTWFVEGSHPGEGRVVVQTIRPEG